MWYYARNRQRMGPVPFAELQRLSVSGGLRPDEMVLEEGKDRWLPAHTVRGLFWPGDGKTVETPPLSQHPNDAPLDACLSGLANSQTVGSREWWGTLRLHLGRAFAWDLRVLSVGTDERHRLAARGATHPSLQNYLSWRRSVLLVLLLPAILIPLLATADNLAGDFRLLSGFGRLWLALRLLAPYAIPVGVVGAILAGADLKLSGKVMAWCWAVAFFAPVLLCLVPVPWLIDFRIADPGERHDVELGARFGFGITVFLLLCLSLPVYVVSAAFGVQRACLRLKSLVPESPVPALFLACAAPVFPLVLLPVFVLTSQLAGGPLLVLGMVCLMGSPLIYLARVRTFLRPATGEEDRQRMRRTQWAAQSAFWTGAFLLLVYAMTRVWRVPALGGELDSLAPSLDGKTLLGFSQETSLFSPWDWRFVRWAAVETLGRSLFTTVLAADLFLRVNRTVWRHNRTLAEGTASPGYDGLMSLLDGDSVAPSAGLRPDSSSRESSLAP